MNIKERRANNLQSRYLRDTGTEPPYTSEMDEDFIAYFKKKIAPDVIASTLRNYKTSIRSFVSDELLLSRLGAISSRPKRDMEKHTASLRSKGISTADMDAIEQYALKQGELDLRSKYGEPTATWLRASILTGLRPHEWQTARIVNDYELHVENNKLSACIQTVWPDRIIMLDHLEAPDLEHITTQMEIVKTMMQHGGGTETENYNKFCKSCGAWLLKTNTKLWPRRVTNINLMSARHQFIANLKISGSYNPKEIAYLVGHATDLRAFESYAATSTGTKDVFLPSIPSDAEDLVDKVRSKFEYKLDNNNKREQLRQFAKDLTSDKTEEEAKPL